jgi:hypothetical protein
VRSAVTASKTLSYDERVRRWRLESTHRRRRRCERASKASEVTRSICAQLYARCAEAQPLYGAAGAQDSASATIESPIGPAVSSDSGRADATSVHGFAASQSDAGAGAALTAAASHKDASEVVRRNTYACLAAGKAHATQPSVGESDVVPVCGRHSHPDGIHPACRGGGGAPREVVDPTTANPTIAAALASADADGRDDACAECMGPEFPSDQTNAYEPHNTGQGQVSTTNVSGENAAWDFADVAAANGENWIEAFTSYERQLRCSATKTPSLAHEAC